VLDEIVGGREMSVASIDPLPVDIHETVARLSATAGLAPSDVLREALALFARELEDRQAIDRAERMTPRAVQLDSILARRASPSAWHDSDEPLF
jgi:hypothetical protein